MKKWIVFLLITVMMSIMFSSMSQASNVTQVNVYLDGKRVTFSDAQPIHTGVRILMPVRGFFEKIGISVDWNKENKTVIVKDSLQEIQMEEGNRAVLNNGVLQFLDCSTLNRNNRVYIPLRYVAESFGYNVTWNQKAKSVYITKGKTPEVSSASLPKINNLETFYQLMKYNYNMNDYLKFNDFRITGTRDMMTSDTAQAAMETAPAMEATKDSAGSSTAPNVSSKSDYSGTNNQVSGVEEGDLIKTDGKNLFVAGKSSLKIISTDPADLRVLSEISCDNGISELYVYQNKLILINSNSKISYKLPDSRTSKIFNDGMFRGYSGSTNVKVYNIADVGKPVLVQDYDYMGRYVSSRMVDDNVYVVTNAGVDFFGQYMRDEFTEIFCNNDKAKFLRIFKEDIKAEQELLQETGFKSSGELFDATRESLEYFMTPKYINNRTGELTEIKLKDVAYFPDLIRPNYLMTIGLDLGGNKPDVKVYLGSSEELYVSAEHLYAALSGYGYNAIKSKLQGYPVYDYHTTVYKFNLNGGKISFETKGKAPGYILNQFSMDEYKGNFRIATTTDRWSSNSANNVYALDTNMKIIGRLEGIAEGEKIYSTRFAGDRIYMVTFRQMDPFFVIDAANPKKLSVLGYLKIPGFSSYMHILDDQHVLGFGYDVKENNGGGISVAGFKLSLFDVTDVANPKEIKNEIIGEKANSPIGEDHKALMISLDKGIMGFPLVYMNTESDYFAGYYLYEVSKDNFAYNGRISHIPDNTIMEEVDEAAMIYRGLYIGEYLYTFSEDRIEVHHLQTLKKAGSLKF